MIQSFALRRVFLVLAGWMILGVQVRGQEAVSGTKAPTYDVVSIKPNKSGSGGMRIQMSGDRYSSEGVSVRTLIQYAYNIKVGNQIFGVPMSMISGVPGSMEGARFDIEAKMDEDAVAALKKLPPEEADAQRRSMMRAMLADRFKLVAHRESKELPMYSLVIAKGGFKLKDADPNNTYPNGIKGPDGVSHAGMMMVGNGRLTAQAIPMSNLAANLTGQLGRIVVDKTGLTGKYDVTLQWAPDDNRGAAPDAGSTADAGPSIFTALQEQLGLRLDATKGPVDMIVVDHVEMPSEN
jgi:uncharacterized protein (TIGR03435 family)